MKQQDSEEQVYHAKYKICPRPKGVKPRPVEIKEDGSGKWSRQEQEVYIQFLSKYFKMMNDKKMRKKKKAFIKMAGKLKTRTPEQCRSHHQKMLQFHQNVLNIITFYEQQVFPLHDYEGNQNSESIIQKILQEKPQKQKEVKTTDKLQAVPVTYRVEVFGASIKIEINSAKVASY